MNPITLLVTAVLAAIGALFFLARMPLPAFGFGALALFTLFALKMANNWERFVILRAGKLSSVKGPGLFMIIPIIDAITASSTSASRPRSSTRNRRSPATPYRSMSTPSLLALHDAQRAALNITDYRSAIDRVAQTSLREMIGSSHLTALLSERKAADEVLRAEIAQKTADWGISVNAVEIRDVAIPVGLQDAMSRQAQAEREKEARVILGSAEAAIAQKFVDAANTYGSNAAAMHLRAMNIIYETTKERGATILMPTSMVDSMSVALPAAFLAQGGAGKSRNRLPAHSRVSGNPAKRLGPRFRGDERETLNTCSRSAAPPPGTA